MAAKMNRRSKGPAQKPKNTKATMLRLLGYLQPHKWMLVLVGVLVLLSSFGSVLGTYLMKPIINNYILPGDLRGLVWILLVLGGVYAVTTLCSYSYTRIMLSVAQKVMHTLRKKLFDHMQTLPIRFFDTHSHGELMSRYTNDVDAVSEALNNSITQVVTSAVAIVSTFVMMMVLSPTLTVITIGMLVVISLLLRFVGGSSARHFGKQQQELGALNGYVEEMIEGQRVVKVFCREPQAIQEFEEKNQALLEASTKAQIFTGIMMPIMVNLSYVTYALTAAVGGFLAVTRGFDIGSLGAFLQYTRSFSQPINQISQQLSNVFSALAGAERIFSILDEKPEEDDGHVHLVYAARNEQGALQKSDVRTGVWAWDVPEKGLIELKGDVRFENVTFAYVPDKTVLKGISLYAKPGQKLAFVGSTGAGKTTITNLINRFYDISDGVIRYDGINIQDISKTSLRASLGIVLQDTHLFTGTILENIRYGRLQASDEEVIEAAKLANAHSFIKRLPHGYNTMLEGDGGNLSQWQRQLLSIARAAVARPPVLILDEATSSVDTRTERIISKSMDQLMEGRTVFAIAHRLSTVRNSDAIIVLENGGIVERGSHTDLIDQQGRYYQLYTGRQQLT